MKPYYSLAEHIELRVKDDYCLALDKYHATFNLMHPSEALILCLLDGKTSLSELTYLVSETYQISESTAQALIKSVLKKSKNYLSPTSSKDNSIDRRYDPKTFILSSSYDYSRLNKPLKTPLALNLVLTRRCNFRCKYCYFGNDLEQSQVLRIDKALDLVNELGGMGGTIVALSGGEPLLYQGLCQVIAAIVNNKMIPMISTNGSLLSYKMVCDLKNAGLQTIQVSLDAPTAEIHHNLTQTRGTFDRVIAGIKTLRSQKIRVNIKSVMTPVNYMLVESLIDLLVEIGVDEIKIVLESAGSCEIPSANSMRKLGDEEISTIKQTVDRKAREYNEKSIIFANPDKKWKNPTEIISCGNLISSFVVHPDGRVSVCEMLENEPELSFGNVYDSSIKEIWLGPAHRRLLELTAPPLVKNSDCSKCQQLSYCRTGCFNMSKLYTGGFFSRDPRCPGIVEMNQKP